MISQKQLFLQLLGQTSPNPLLIEVERAQGVYMYTPQGKQIIDVISGVSQQFRTLSSAGSSCVKNKHKHICILWYMNLYKLRK